MTSPKASFRLTKEQMCSVSSLKGDKECVLEEAQQLLSKFPLRILSYKLSSSYIEIERQSIFVNHTH